MPDQPNILFIHTDSMDGRRLGCMGDPAMRRATPHLDRLAEHGTLFERCHSNNPICCPSRASMWSGRWAHQVEAWNNYEGLEPDDPTFRTRLEEAGYATQSYGKEDYRSGHHTVRARVAAWLRSAPIHRPTSSARPPEIVEDHGRRLHESDWEDVDRATAWLTEYARDPRAPFWLYLGIRRPHFPFRTNRRYLEMVAEGDIELPPDDPNDHPVVRYHREHTDWPFGTADDTVRSVRHIYFAMIAEVDAMVGDVLAALDRLGLAENTVVVFGSDHGELALEHRLLYKGIAYEPAVRVPLIVAGPGVPRGRRVEELVSLVDIHPTFLELAGREPTPELVGRSLLPLLSGSDPERSGEVMSEFHDSSCNASFFMLRRDLWKYVAYPGYPSQLFDLESDPSEIENLAADWPEVVADLDRRLRAIADYEVVARRVREYERESFRRWRAEQHAAGQYEALMARIFSGWRPEGDPRIEPWTADNEAVVERWLAGEFADPAPHAETR